MVNSGLPKTTCTNHGVQTSLACTSEWECKRERRKGEKNKGRRKRRKKEKRKKGGKPLLVCYYYIWCHSDVIS